MEVKDEDKMDIDIENPFESGVRYAGMEKYGRSIFIGTGPTQIEKSDFSPKITLERAITEEDMIIFTYPLIGVNISGDDSKKQFFFIRIETPRDFLKHFEQHLKDGKLENIETYLTAAATSENINNFGAFGPSVVPANWLETRITNPTTKNDPRLSWKEFKATRPPGMYVMILDFEILLKFANKFFEDRLGIRMRYKYSDRLQTIYTSEIGISLYQRGRNTRRFPHVVYKYGDAPSFFILKVAFMSNIFKAFHREYPNTMNLAVIPRMRTRANKIFDTIHIKGNLDIKSYLKRTVNSFNNFNNSDLFRLISNRFELVVKLNSEFKKDRFLKFYTSLMEEFINYSGHGYNVIFEEAYQDEKRCNRVFDKYQAMEWEWAYSAIKMDLIYLPLIPKSVIQSALSIEFMEKDIKTNVIENLKAFPIDLEIQLFDNEFYRNHTTRDDKYLDWLDSGTSIRHKRFRDYDERKKYKSLENSVLNWLEFKFGMVASQKHHFIIMKLNSKVKFRENWGGLGLVEKFMFFYQLFLTDKYITLVDNVKNALFPFLTQIPNTVFTNDSTRKKMEIDFVTKKEKDIKSELEFLREYIYFHKHARDVFTEIKRYLLDRNFRGFYHRLVMNSFDRLEFYDILRHIVRLTGFIIVDDQNSYLGKIINQMDQAHLNMIPVEPALKGMISIITSMPTAEKKWSVLWNYLIDEFVKELTKTKETDVGPQYRRHFTVARILFINIFDSSGDIISKRKSFFFFF